MRQAGTSGTTNWDLYDVPQIAAMLDESFEPAWAQVFGLGSRLRNPRRTPPPIRTCTR